MFVRRLSTISSNITSHNTVSALSVFKNSCYHKIDFKINEDNTANNAVKRFAAFNIGCLAVTDNNNNIVNQ